MFLKAGDGERHSDQPESGEGRGRARVGDALAAIMVVVVLLALGTELVVSLLYDLGVLR